MLATAAAAGMMGTVWYSSNTTNVDTPAEMMQAAKYSMHSSDNTGGSSMSTSAFSSQDDYATSSQSVIAWSSSEEDIFERGNGDGDCCDEIIVACDCCRECTSPLDLSDSESENGCDCDYQTSHYDGNKHFESSTEDVEDRMKDASFPPSPILLERIPSYEYRPFHYYEPAVPLFLAIRLKVLQFKQRKEERERRKRNIMRSGAVATESPEAPEEYERWQRAVRFAAFHSKGSTTSDSSSSELDTLENAPVPDGLKLLLRRLTV